MKDAQAAAAAAKHRIRFRQRLDTLVHARRRHPELRRQRASRLGFHGQELVQRRVQQADGHRPLAHHGKERAEVLALKRQQRRQRGAAFALVRGENHAPHLVQAFLLEEHVLGAAQADALGAEPLRLLGRGRGVGVGAHRHAPMAVRPRHHGGEALVPRARGRGQFPGQNPPHLRRRSGHAAGVHGAGAAVQRHRIAFAQQHPAHGQGALAVVDDQRAGAANAHLAELPRHQGRVRRDAAPGGEDAIRRKHALQVFRAGFGAAKHYRRAVLGGRGGGLGRERQTAGGRARPGRQAAGDELRLGQRARVEGWREQGVDGVRRYAAQRRRLVHQPFGMHVHGDAHGGRAGAFRAAGLQQMQAAFLDGELEVLHVAEVPFELGGYGLQLGVQRRPLVRHVGQRRWRMAAGHHVLALRVHQVLAVQPAGAAARIAGERNARGAGRAAVAEHHRLHVHRRAPSTGNTVALPIARGALVVPRAEHGADGGPELRPRVLRKRRPGVFGHHGLKAPS